MDQKFKVALGAIFAFLCGLCVSNQAFAQTLPDGKGKAEFVHNCTACHRADMVTRVKKTPDDWKKSVFEMASRGTDGSKEDLDNVVLYLDTFYAADKPAPAAATPSTTPSSTQGNSSDLDHVRQLVADNLCLTCHRIEQRGAYLAPSLNGIGARATAGEIHTAIVSPKPSLEPSNYLVRLTTADGKTLTGRILSQDDHQVRVIDASGEVTTYSKPELQQFTVIDTNPMPSYERRITADDMDSLVRFLASLPPVDENIHK